MQIKDKMIAITGAAGGIGSEICIALDNLGARLILLDLNPDKLQALNAVLSNKHVTKQIDLSNAHEITQLAYDIQRQGIKIDVLINSAGIGIYKSINELSHEEFERSLKINITAPFLLIKHFMPIFAEKAKVINIGSVCGTQGIAERSAYCTTKFGLRGLSLSLSEELKSLNIDVCYLTLGSTLTDFGPLTVEEKINLRNQGKKYFEPSEVAKKICQVLQDDKNLCEVVLDPEKA